MPVKPEAAIEYLGLKLEEFEDDDAFKAHFDGQFVRREIAHDDSEVKNKVFGKINSVLRGKMKNLAKANGIDGVEFDKTDPADLVDILNEKLSGSVTALREELTEAKKSTGGKATKEVEELQRQLQAATTERDAFGSQAADFEARYKDLEGGMKQREAQARVDGAFSRALEALPFREDVNGYARKGFESEIRSKYKLEFGEDGITKVLDADGKPLMNASKAQTYLSLDEIVKKNAEEAKLVGGNPQAGTGVKRTVTTMATTTPSANSAPPPAERPRGPRVMPMG